MTMRFTPSFPVRRDNSILKHIYRMRLSTPEIVHQMYFPDATLNAVSQVMKRHAARRSVNSYPLWGKRIYWTLGSRWIRSHGVSRRRTLPIGEQALPVEYGVLIYCCRNPDGIVRKRLLPHELQKPYPWFPDSMLHHPFCLEHGSSTRRLAAIRVEASSSTEHIIEKHLQVLYRWRQVAEFDQLFRDDGFMFVNITPTVEAAERLDHATQQIPDYPPASSFMDLPELVHLIR